MELHVDNEGRQFLTSRTALTRLDLVRLPENDIDPVSVWLLDRPDTAGQPLIPAAIPAPYDGLILTARPEADLEADVLLFSLSDFTGVGLGAILSSSAADPAVITTAAAHGLDTGDQVAIAGHAGSAPGINGLHAITVLSDTTFSIPIAVTTGGAGGTWCGPDGHYDGVLFLDTDAMRTALTGRKTLLVYLEVELTKADATRARRLTPHSRAIALRDIYRGNEGVPTSGDPAYPLPGPLIDIINGLLIGGHARFVAIDTGADRGVKLQVKGAADAWIDQIQFTETY